MQDGKRGKDLRVAYGDALPLYSVLPIGQNAQQQVSYSIV